MYVEFFWGQPVPEACSSCLRLCLFLSVAVQESNVTTQADDVGQHTGSQSGDLLTDTDNPTGTVTTHAPQSSSAGPTATSSSVQG